MKVYIICPYNQSGGPRSLHQLGNKLIESGLDVYMYYGYRGKLHKTETLLYNDSKAKIATKIEDKKDNLLIVPESDTGWISKYQNIKTVVWWLSLYFYLENNFWWLAKFRTSFLNQPRFLSFFRYVRMQIKNPSVSYVYPKDLNKIDYHLYNCEYVHEFLGKQGIDKNKMSYLCGPIDIDEKNKEDFIDKKENLIIYNPAKASPYMIKKILEYMKKNYPEYKFKALKNLAHEEVLEYLKKAKIYLDLGYFPGPERMPREATMNYCNIITSTVGAAKNNIDVPIPPEFKFDLKKENVPKICNLIVDMCENYSSYTNKFDKYRKKTKNQIDNFSKDIDKFEKVITEKLN